MNSIKIKSVSIEKATKRQLTQRGKYLQTMPLTRSDIQNTLGMQIT